MRRKLFTLTLIAALAFSTLGADSCSKSERDQNIAWAKDIQTAVHRAEPHVIALRPGIAKNYARALPIADSIVAALENNKIETVKDLLRELIPIFTEATATFTDDRTVLAILALGDIGLHVLLNRLPDDQVIAAAADSAPKKGGVRAAAARATKEDLDTLRAYRDQQTWGCAYLPKKCVDNVEKVTP